MNNVNRAKELGLVGKDIIHNPNEISFKPFVKDTEPYQIENFLTSEELLSIKNFFDNKLYEDGHSLSDSLYFLMYPFNYPLIREILKPKIKKELGEFYSYSDIHFDIVPQSSDFFILQNNIFMPHTDSITHIPGYLPHKDVLIPLAIDKDKSTNMYTCEQRYYKRSSHLKYGHFSDYVTKYSNIFRCKPYNEYGIENVTFDPDKMINEDWLNHNIGDSQKHSIFQGLSIRREFEWIPGSAIIQDTSIIHGPTNFKLRGAKWKLGISIRVFKKNPDWQPNTLYSQYEPVCGLSRLNNDQNLPNL